MNTDVVAAIQRRADKMIPVAEVFGPTIQGEGPDAGRPVFFVRTGGCDYNCSWCDSLHAVIPELVRKLERITQDEIANRLLALGAGYGSTIVLSGGNPALHDLSRFVAIAKEAHWRVTVETQGTKWKDWLHDADLVVVSPKPPTSGMTTERDVLDSFMERALLRNNVTLKVVVGDYGDYLFAVDIHGMFPSLPFYLSVLNPAGSDQDTFDVNVILEGYRLLCERVASDPQMRDAKVLPQLHTLAWGAMKGV